MYSPWASCRCADAGSSTALHELSVGLGQSWLYTSAPRALQSLVSPRRSVGDNESSARCGSPATLAVLLDRPNRSWPRSGARRLGVFLSRTFIEYPPGGTAQLSGFSDVKGVKPPNILTSRRVSAWQVRHSADSRHGALRDTRNLKEVVRCRSPQFLEFWPQARSSSSARPCCRCSRPEPSARSRLSTRPPDRSAGGVCQRNKRRPALLDPPAGPCVGRFREVGLALLLDHWQRGECWAA